MYRLLIADDEMIERKVLFKTLSQNLKGQCEIFQAENGREALEIYEKEKIQIAILDIEMPGINGIQAAERIREKDKKCCIIFLTAFDEFAYAKKAITVRALDYLLKPWDEKELMLVLEEAMRMAGEEKDFQKEKTEEVSEEEKRDDPEELAEDDAVQDEQAKAYFSDAEQDVLYHPERYRIKWKLAEWFKKWTTSEQTDHTTSHISDLRTFF